eukprot:1433625-Rhodomonas_salina.4
MENTQVSTNLAQMQAYSSNMTALYNNINELQQPNNWAEHEERMQLFQKSENIAPDTTKTTDKQQSPNPNTTSRRSAGKRGHIFAQ